jgi:hypothetical protein
MELSTIPNNMQAETLQNMQPTENQPRQMTFQFLQVLRAVRSLLPPPLQNNIINIFVSLLQYKYLFVLCLQFLSHFVDILTQQA